MKISTPSTEISVAALVESGLAEHIHSLPQLDQVFVLTDTTTSKYCLPRLIAVHPAFKNFKVLEFEAGEEYKTIETCTSIWQTLLQMGATRNSLLINLGGGVVTDLGGFVAATFKRGMRFINIPTTLLAQADASVGGKTGVDFEGLKNQIGVFANPLAVYIDVAFLDSLSKREWFNGFAEMIKHSILESSDSWSKLRSLSITDKSDFENLLFHSVSYKHRIVGEDFTESGYRKILNFGHTAGHAIESFFLEGDRPSIKHGEAVVAGMIIELFISEEKTGISITETESIVNYLMEFYSKIPIEKTDFVRLIQIMKTDKKNRGNEINFTLLKSIGQPVYNQQVLPVSIEKALKRYRMI